MTDRQKLRQCIIHMTKNNLSTRDIGKLLKLSQSTVCDLMHRRFYRLKESRAKHYIRRYQDIAEMGYVDRQSKVVSLYGEPK